MSAFAFVGQHNGGHTSVPESGETRAQGSLRTAWVFAACTASLASLACTLGGDSLWLVAAEGAGADGDRLPYTVNAEPSWPPVLTLARRVFDVTYELAGERGLQLLHVMAVAATFALLVVDARRSGVSTRRLTTGLCLVFMGAATSLLIVRLQLFSLPMFAALILLLRDETRRPSARIWLLPVLLAVWSNLHGGALVGAAVAGAYLLLHRLRQLPRQSIIVLLCSLAALCLTPALLDTPRYYLGVLQNELARQHAGLWARPDPLGSPFDLALLVAVGALLLAAAMTRTPLWQIAVLLGLSAMTVEAARSGVWLLLFAVGAGASATPASLIRRPRWPVVVAILASTTVLIVGVARGPLQSGADQNLLDRAVRLSGGSPVAAEGVLGEQVALAGGCLWATNPLDAFPRPVQKAYVRWLETGDPTLLPPGTRIALVATDGKPARRLAETPGFRLIARHADVDLFAREAPSAPLCTSWRQP